MLYVEFVLYRDFRNLADWAGRSFWYYGPDRFSWCTDISVHTQLSSEHWDGQGTLLQQLPL